MNWYWQMTLKVVQYADRLRASWLVIGQQNKVALEGFYRKNAFQDGSYGPKHSTSRLKISARAFLSALQSFRLLVLPLHTDHVWNVMQQDFHVESSLEEQNYRVSASFAAPFGQSCS